MHLLKSIRKKRSIYFFLSNLSGGGAQRTIVNIISGIDRSNYKIKLVLLKYNKNDPYVSLVPRDVVIINLNSRARSAIWKIKKLIDNENPDILFSTLPHVNFAVWLGRKISRKKPLLVLRETNFRKIGINTSLLKHKVYKKMYRNADHVIGLSKGVTEHMKEEYGLNALKITTIYNPIDIKGITNKMNEQCSIKYTKKYKFITCGRLVQQKNHLLLINALKLIKEQGFEDFELFILGEGPEKDNLEKEIVNSNLTEHIKLIGFKKNPYSYMKQADLFILSSLWEGFGHVIVESMVCGTPVLSTDCQHGPSEILCEGKYGWLVKNNNPDELFTRLIYLIKNDLELKEMSGKIHKRVNDFDSGKIIDEYMKLFNQLLDSTMT